MNIYNYHNKPENLHGHQDKEVNVPELLRRDMIKGSLSKAQRQKIYQSALLSLSYAQLMEAPVPEGEAVIAKDGKIALTYAHHILKGPFPKGEKTIASNKYTAINYAKTILFKPFPEGEKAILTDKYTTLDYVKSIIQDKWPTGEATLDNKWTRHQYNALLQEWGYGRSDMLVDRDGNVRGIGGEHI